MKTYERASAMTEETADLAIVGTRILVEFTDGATLTMDSVTRYEDSRDDFDCMLGEDSMEPFLRIEEFLGTTHYINMDVIARVALEPVSLVSGETMGAQRTESVKAGTKKGKKSKKSKQVTDG